MFDSLTDRLTGIFGALRQRGALTEADVTTALREIRVALLEADVSLAVAKDFVAKVQERAIGQEVIRSITPAQMVVKIVHDTLIEMLGAENESVSLEAALPVGILMVGLQGSGKTTTTAKIALRLKDRERKRVLMASLDVNRPPRRINCAFWANRLASIRCRSLPGKRRSRLRSAPSVSPAPAVSMS